MTLLEEIQAKCSFEMLANRDDGAIATLLSIGRTKLRKTNIGEGGIIAAIGDLTAANNFLDAVNAVAEYRHIKKVISRGDFDMGDLMSQAGVQAMVPAVLTQMQADNLKALGLVHDPVSAQQVSQALENYTP